MGYRSVLSWLPEEVDANAGHGILWTGPPGLMDRDGEGDGLVADAQLNRSVREDAVRKTLFLTLYMFSIIRNYLGSN
jgi:hypothetical protein